MSPPRKKPRRPLQVVMSADMKAVLRATAKAEKRPESQIIDELFAKALFAKAAAEGSSGREDPYVEAKIAARREDGSTAEELECALLNFVNIGFGELAVPSFSGSKWIDITITCDSPLERALQRAYRRQLEALAAGATPAFPTRPRWRKKDLAAVDPERLAQLVWVWRLLDRIVELLASGVGTLRVTACKHCGAFISDRKPSPGRPRDFCGEEHRIAHRDMTAYQRKRRAAIRKRDAKKNAASVRRVRARHGLEPA